MQVTWRFHGFIATIAVAALIATPSASASSHWQADLEATNIRAGPASDLDALLSIFVSESQIGSGATPPAEFRLEAEHARVEMDYMEARVWTGLTYYGVAGGTTEDSYDRIQAHGLANRPGYRLIVIPQETGSASLQIRSQCGDMNGSDTDTVRRIAWAATPPNRPTVEVDVSQSLAWQDCSEEATLRVVGDFVVALWEWDFVVRGNHGEQHFETGRLTHPALQDVPADVSDSVSRDQEAWVFVKNGSLTWKVTKGVPHALYASSDAVLESDTGFLLQDATGKTAIDDYSEIVAREIYLKGNLDLTVHGIDSTNAIQTRVNGELAELYINDAPVWALAGQVPVVSTEQAWAAPVLIALLLALVALVLLAPQAYYRSLEAAEARKLRGLPGASWRQRQGSALTVMARNAYHRDHFHRTLLFARLAVWFHNHPQVHIVRAIAYSDLGRLRHAHQVHAYLDRLLEEMDRERCRNAWHAYQVLREEDPALAFSWYRRARAYDPLEFRALAASTARRASTRPRPAPPA